MSSDGVEQKPKKTSPPEVPAPDRPQPEKYVTDPIVPKKGPPHVK
jgi:hypothetical protein